MPPNQLRRGAKERQTATRNRAGSRLVRARVILTCVACCSGCKYGDADEEAIILADYDYDFD